MLAAHEFFFVRRTIALRQDDPVKWFEVVAAVKVDKSGSHNSLPRTSTAAPAEIPYAAACCGRATGAAGGKYH